MKRLLTAALLVLTAACGSDDEPTAVATTAPTSAPVGAADESTLVVLDTDELTNSHVQPGATFSHSPSLGGDHYPFWMNCGFYEIEVIEGAATHTLEHGAVWLTYGESTPAADVEALRALAADNDRVLVSPYPQADALVVTAWGAQLRGDLRPGSDDVIEFLDTYVDSDRAPEPGAACDRAAGIPPNDIRTLADGTEVPPEWD